MYNVPMSRNYFNDALQNFTSDFAYKGQVRHLYTLGLSALAIKERLDYPVSYDTVKNYLWEYLVASKQVVFTLEDITTENREPAYVEEYDSFGRKTFRLVQSASSEKIQYINLPMPGKFREIPDLTDCYVKFKGSDIKNFKEKLCPADCEYLEGFPWPDSVIYLKLNEKTVAIFASLFSEEISPDAIISPVSHIIYS